MTTTLEAGHALDARARAILAARGEKADDYRAYAAALAEAYGERAPAEPATRPTRPDGAAVIEQAERILARRGRHVNDAGYDELREALVLAESELAEGSVRAAGFDFDDELRSLKRDVAAFAERVTAADDATYTPARRREFTVRALVEA